MVEPTIKLPPLKTKLIARDLFMELLSKRPFEKYTAETILDELMCSANKEVCTFDDGVLTILNNAVRPHCSCYETTLLQDYIDTLTRVINSAADFFVTSGRSFENVLFSTLASFRFQQDYSN